MTMIERVALGMLAAFFDGEKAAPSETWTDRQESADLSAFTVDGDIDLRGLARAALEAMREPTPEMEGDGLKAVDPTNPHRIDVANNVWQAMLSAAINEQPRPVDEKEGI